MRLLMVLAAIMIGIAVWIVCASSDRDPEDDMEQMEYLRLWGEKHGRKE